MDSGLEVLEKERLKWIVSLHVGKDLEAKSIKNSEKSAILLEYSNCAQVTCSWGRKQMPRE